jgi:propionate CoA-transferase
LTITSEGKIKKFINNIDQISFSGKIAIEEQREILYVTERCVFRLTQEGLLLTEIAPGIDLQRDIFDQMEFRPSVAENLKEMSSDYFRI